jgi:hypothetical protein
VGGWDGRPRQRRLPRGLSALFFALYLREEDDVTRTEGTSMSDQAPKISKDTFFRALLRPFRGASQNVSPNNRLAVSSFGGVDRPVSRKNALVGSDLQMPPEHNR